MNIIQENNWVITKKKGKVKLPLFCGNVERLTPIYGVYHRLFGNVYFQDLRKNSDHYLILECLHSSTLSKHAKYLGRSMLIPLCTPITPTI